MPEVLTILVLAGLSIWRKKLTFSGGISGALLALLLFAGGGRNSLFLLATFFLGGLIVSRYRIAWKQRQALVEPQEAGIRSHANVLANGGVAGICALLALAFPDFQPLFVLMLAASLAAVLSDTCSSELGNVWGRRYWNILSFRKDQRGKDGVVSLNGTLVGLLAALLMALLYVWLEQRPPLEILLVTVAGFLGNLTDSLLGATLERKRVLDNHSVNFLSSLTAALLAGAMSVPG